MLARTGKILRYLFIFTALVIDIFVLDIIHTLVTYTNFRSDLPQIAKKKSSPKSKSTQSDWNKIDWV